MEADAKKAETKKSNAIDLAKRSKANILKAKASNDKAQVVLAELNCTSGHASKPSSSSSPPSPVANTETATTDDTDDNNMI